MVPVPFALHMSYVSSAIIAVQPTMGDFVFSAKIVFCSWLVTHLRLSFENRLDDYQIGGSC